MAKSDASARTWTPGGTRKRSAPPELLPGAWLEPGPGQSPQAVTSGSPMSTSYKVQFWEHRVRLDRRKPYMVRWTVAGREFSESFLTKTQADGRKAVLVVAARS